MFKSCLLSLSRAHIAHQNRSCPIPDTGADTVLVVIYLHLFEETVVPALNSYSLFPEASLPPLGQHNRVVSPNGLDLLALGAEHPCLLELTNNFPVALGLISPPRGGGRRDFDFSLWSPLGNLAHR